MSIVRRSIDVAVGTVGLIVLSPAILAMTAISRLESGKPGIFRQVRYGKASKPFKIAKIRTLDEDLNPLPISGRFRKIGLDEAPQLFHLITGEMSLVGPRPHDRLMTSLAHWDHVLKIRPGLAGLSAVVAKENGTIKTVEAKCAIEATYVSQRLSSKSCLATDLDILYRSAKLVLGARADFAKHDGWHASREGNMEL